MSTKFDLQFFYNNFAANPEKPKPYTSKRTKRTTVIKNGKKYIKTRIIITYHNGNETVEDFEEIQEENTQDVRKDLDNQIKINETSNQISSQIVGDIKPDREQQIINDIKSNRNKNNVDLNYENFINSALKKHNSYRNLHGVPDLVLNNELNKLALDWANDLANNDNLQYSDCQWGDKRIGENIATLTTSDITTGEFISNIWYNEIKNYNFDDSDFDSESSHFTQVVWKDSKEVGFGLAKSSTGNIYAVGNYYPAGNFIGEFDKNVFPLKNIIF